MEVLKTQISSLNEEVSSLNEKIVGNDAVNFELITEINQIKEENSQLRTEKEGLTLKVESHAGEVAALK